MDPVSYFKSINMQREMEIAGDFIYESAKRMKHLNYFSNHCEINLILYTGSVGIERLQKILITLYCDDIPDGLSKIKCMMKHTPVAADDYISTLVSSKVDSNQRSMLGLFTEYYNNFRYADYVFGKDVDDLINLFQAFLKRQDGKFDFSSTHILSEYEKFKKFYINTLGKLTEYYYRIIYDQSHNLNVYPWELHYESSACKVFYKDPSASFYDLFDLEDLSARELLVYLFRYDTKSNIFNIIDEVNPLDFDPADISDYTSELCSGRINIGLHDFVETSYEEINTKRERERRKSLLRLIANTDIDFLSKEYVDSLDEIFGNDSKDENK